MDVTSRFGGIFNFKNDLHIFGFVCSRRKYEMTDITFKSIADLRRESASQSSTIQLIKSYVEKINIENYENADSVTNFFY